MTSKVDQDVSPPDEVLMDRVRAGDDRALGIVYDRHAPMVFAVTRAILGSEADAEEVSESVFLHLWTNGDRFDPTRGSVQTYLAMVARSRARDRVRAMRRREAAIDRSAADGPEEFAAPVSNPGSDPVRDVVTSELRERLDSLLASIGPDQREAIELAYFNGLTQREIADRIDAPLGTVKTRIRDGMSKLRAMVAEGGQQP